MRTITPKEARLIPREARRVFKGEIYEVYQWQQEMFDGSTETFEMLKRPDTVKIIAVKDKKIILLKEEQPYLGIFYGIPAGKHDVKGETEVEAAKREMLEETGLVFRNWRLIRVLQPSDITEQFIYYFLATDFEKQEETNLESGEKIEILPVDYDKFLKYMDHPKARYMPKELFEEIDSIEELVNFPEYKN